MHHSAPLILALDVATEDLALDWVKRLQSKISLFKVGMQLFYHSGPNIVRRIQDLGARVFLDLKLHDIPNTVASACESLCDLDVALLTVHTSGGVEMMAAAQAVFEGTSTRLLGVTALTSLDEAALKSIYPGVSKTPTTWAVQLAYLAQQAGLYGIVCSAQENPLMRRELGASLGLVNPGIRLNSEATHDQKRIMTPGEAIQSGANYLVVGRPILHAVDPLGTTDQILEEMSYAAGLSA